MAKINRFLKYWLPVLLWMTLIFTASADTKSYQHSSLLFEPLMHWLFPSMSQETVGRLHEAARKCAHLTEYGVFALLLWRALHRPQRNEPCRWNWSEAGLALAIVFAYAATDEFHQIFVSGRTPQVSDVFVDTGGGAAALLLLWLGRKLFRRPRA